MHRLPMLLVRISEVVPCLVVKVFSLPTVGSDGRMRWTNSADTADLRAISRSDHFAHSASLSNVRTVRNLLLVIKLSNGIDQIGGMSWPNQNHLGCRQTQSTN